MKAIVNTGPSRLEMIESPLPAPKAGQVRIRTAACGICATDLEMIAGWERTSFGAIPGHEWSGVVDAVGQDVEKSIIGRRCVAENVLADGGEVGFEHPGGYAEYLITESNKIQFLPQDFPLTAAALIEPLAVSVRAITRLGTRLAEPVLILGDGPIGLLILLLLKKAGPGAVMLAGGRENRLKLAEEFGAARTFNYHHFQDGLSPGLRNAARCQFKTIIEASGSENSINAAMELAAAGCRILVIGDYRNSCARFKWNTILLRELELIGSNASAGAWPQAVRLAVEQRLPLDKLITHRLPAAQFAKGLEIMRDRTQNAVKVVLEWGNNA